VRETIVAIVQTTAKAAGERVMKDGGDKRAVALAVMKDAHENWMAPEEEEAFSGAVAALWNLYPDDASLRQETAAIGDRNKMLSALMNGIPVDFDAFEPTPVPDDAIGLLDIWKETARA